MGRSSSRHDTDAVRIVAAARMANRDDQCERLHAPAEEPAEQVRHEAVIDVDAVADRAEIQQWRPLHESGRRRREIPTLLSQPSNGDQ